MSVFKIIENALSIDLNTIIAVSFSTAIVAFLIVFVIRWLGNKGLGQLSTIELIIILGLGEAVGQSMLIRVKLLFLRDLQSLLSQ